MLGKKWNRQVPVYLFTGFLGSGKTEFLNDSMKEEDFAGGERNLCVLTEQGRVTPLESYGNNEVAFETINGQENFTREYLQLLNEKHRPEKIIIECNGMWELEKVYNNLPDNWIIVQEMTFIDAGLFNMFNMNMRNLVYDKMKFADMVIFNRVDEKKMDLMAFHKAVRVANRSAQIIYELLDGTIKVDEVEDPLPFDVEASFIDLEDRDFAYWYRDIMAEAPKYKGKTMRFSGVIKSKGIKGEDKFVIGRPIMTCCEEDIEFMGTRCQNKSGVAVEHNKWATITGKIAMGKSRQEGEVPVMVVTEIEYGEMPEQTLATFY